MDIKKIFKGAGIFLAIGAVIAFVGGVLYFSGKNKNKAVVPGAPEPVEKKPGSVIPQKPYIPSPAGTSTSGGVVPPITITNFDSVWDYKHEAGKWYTKKKDATVWVDMKTKLSPEAYATAVQRLTAFIKK